LTLPGLIDEDGSLDACFLGYSFFDYPYSSNHVTCLKNTIVKCLGEQTDVSGYRFDNGNLSKMPITTGTTVIWKYCEDVQKKWPLNGLEKSRKEALFSTVQILHEGWRTDNHLEGGQFNFS
jgi:hypothetical protein